MIRWEQPWKPSSSKEGGRIEKVRIAGVSKTALRKAGLSSESTADLSSLDSRDVLGLFKFLEFADGAAGAGHRSPVSCGRGE